MTHSLRVIALQRNDFDDDAKQALKAAARSGLELYLKTPLPELSVDSDDDDD